MFNLADAHSMRHLRDSEITRGFCYIEPNRSVANKVMCIRATARIDAQLFWGLGKKIDSPFTDRFANYIWNEEFGRELGQLANPYDLTPAFMASRFG
jgi:hypothetical protein